jgi:hypothetical protein
VATNMADRLRKRLEVSLAPLHGLPSLLNPSSFCRVQGLAEEAVDLMEDLGLTDSSAWIPLRPRFSPKIVARCSAFLVAEVITLGPAAVHRSQGQQHTGARDSSTSVLQ